MGHLAGLTLVQQAVVAEGAHAALPGGVFGGRGRGPGGATAARSLARVDIAVELGGFWLWNGKSKEG